VHTLTFGKCQESKVTAYGRHPEAVANRFDARVSALNMPIMDRQVLARRIRLADVHHQQGETHRQRRVTLSRFGKAI
jgi:hypothetical protein